MKKQGEKQVFFERKLNPYFPSLTVKKYADFFNFWHCPNFIFLFRVSKLKLEKIVDNICGAYYITNV